MNRASPLTGFTLTLVIAQSLLFAGPAAATEPKEVVFAEGTRWATTAVVRETGVEGPTVFILGGMHGNEPAGYLAAEQIRHWPIQRGKVVVLPRINRLGTLNRTREVPAAEPYDLNRQFPKDPATPVTGPIAGDVFEFLESLEPDWLVDLHESVDYRYRTTEKRKTLGNTLIVFPEERTEAVARLMIAAANDLTEVEERRWVGLRWPIDGSLARAAGERLGAHALIVETCRRDYLGARIRQHRVVVHRLLTELSMLPEGFSPHATFPAERVPGEVRVALFNDRGTGGNSAYAIARCLPRDSGIVTRRITAAEIRAGALSAFDAVVFPGGSGSGTAKALGEKGRERVRAFVEEGGGYLGVCAGAYLATAHYPWSLGILDARVVDTAHWARGRGTVRIALTDLGRGALAEERERVSMRYAQGPLLAPANRDEIPDFEVLSRYETEIAKNGAPAGVMVGTPAAVRGTFGKGRVAVVGPHPESSEDLSLRKHIRRLVDWVAGNHDVRDEREAVLK